MKANKIIGILLIAGTLGVFIPYTILTMTFDYPDILRQDSGNILVQFHEAGSPLIFTWLAFALLGLPLIVAYSMIGQKLQDIVPYSKWITTIGIISGIVQIIGLLRWVFVVPVLANDFVASDFAQQENIKIIFKVIHQFGGVLLGEHLGQLFTVIWTAGISVAMMKAKLISKHMAVSGIIIAFIYFLAQAELLQTVIADFPVIAHAGFVGSTLWLGWLMVLGVWISKGKLEQHRNCREGHIVHGP